MKKMLKYRGLIVFFLAASLLGILIEFVVNRDIIWSGLFIAIGLFFVTVFQMKSKEKKNDV